MAGHENNTNNGTIFSIDALLPSQMALKAEDVGVAKANLDNFQVFLLAVLAGAFIAFASQFYTISIVDTEKFVGYGITRIIGGLAFSLGLILVVIGGAELFTGNNLKVMALASGRVTISQVLRNWIIVYIGNFVGSVGVVYGVYLTGQHSFAGSHIGAAALNIAEAKCALPFVPALFRGIFCNIFVCLAVWLCYSARSNTDKVLCIMFPITAFVAAGFEHCVANMYFIPMGLLLKSNGSFLASIGRTAADFSHLSMRGLISNLIPVTIGNIIGGSVLVGVIYWLIYRRKK